MNGLRAGPSIRDSSGWIAVGGGFVALLTLALWMRYGPAGLVLPPLAAAAVALVQRPAWAVGLLVGVVVLGERNDDGILPAFTVLYDPAAGGLTPVELLLGVAIVAVVLDVQRRGSARRLPAALALPLALLALAIVSGALTGLFAGVSGRDVLYAGRQLVLLVAVPPLVFHLVRTERHVRVALAAGAALAALKAALGLAGVLAGRGLLVEGARITYYEPAANALMLLVVLGVVAALVGPGPTAPGTPPLRARIPAWVLLTAPLLVLSLALSLRRSFWIGAALGLLLVLALPPLGRRVLVPSALLVAAAVWVLSSVGFQVAGPLVERARSLQPSRIAVNVEDRYRIDERKNVMAELGRRPVTGLGLGVPWVAEHPLPTEHENGRQYTHVVLLWHWLKLGLLGLAAYLAIVLGAARLAWQAWRRHPDPLLRAAGLGALCWIVALAAIETTGSFTGVDARFTVLLGAILGVLAAVATRLPPAPARSPAATARRAPPPAAGPVRPPRAR